MVLTAPLSYTVKVNKQTNIFETNKETYLKDVSGSSQLIQLLSSLIATRNVYGKERG